tara:strand:- start:9445 stop:10386 length:942 start_codon:yes stop_codon:yes gene_type:complete
MKLRKPIFWDKELGLTAILLYPITLIMLFLINLRKEFIKSKKFEIPIICVGNIYIGGTGKTPTSLYLANELLKSKKNPLILRKYYSNHSDEYNLIKNNFKNLAVCKDRVKFLNEMNKSSFDTVILDDGFQDLRIKKDINIICFNQNQLIGNGLTLPSGPLREKLSSLKNADVIIINGKKDKKFEEKLIKINEKLEIFYSCYKPINLDQFKNTKLMALAGIGNPENFFRLLEENNLEIGKKISLPDHYKFSKNEIEKLIDEAESKNYKIIMTEKDFYKINHFNFKKINYLKVLLKIDKEEIFFKKIFEIYDKNI